MPNKKTVSVESSFAITGTRAIEIAKQYFPSFTDEEVADFLWERTGWPGFLV